jgi:copper(I)-binding protein
MHAQGIRVGAHANYASRTINNGELAVKNPEVYENPKGSVETKCFFTDIPCNIAQPVEVVAVQVISGKEHEDDLDLPFNMRVIQPRPRHCLLRLDM